MSNKSLADWLTWLETCHVKAIDLNLERINQIASRLDLLPFLIPAIVVGGTNGKGSTVAMLESVYCSAGYKTGCYTSPHLLRFNERIKIAKTEISDHQLCLAFAEIYQNLGNMTLTYFEYTTLAALYLFKQQSVDIAILEVGLGGRLDAVNIIDANCSIVTSVSIDHTQWLGDTIEKIALEKAGIFRPNKPAIYADTNPPTSLVNYAEIINADLLCFERDYSFFKQKDEWCWNGLKHQRILPNLLLQGEHQAKNAAACCMAVESLDDLFPISEHMLQQGLNSFKIVGRCQEVLINNRKIVVDVAHNVASIEKLAEFLNQNPIKGKTVAVFSMLADKNIANIMPIVGKFINSWYVAEIKTARAAKMDEIVKHIKYAMQGKTMIFNYDTISEALNSAYLGSSINDRIIIFGSFHVAAVGIDWLINNFNVEKIMES